MPTDHRADLAKIRRFDQLIPFLRDEMRWPITPEDFESDDDLFFPEDDAGDSTEAAGR